jgi:predicted Ser/Thr protein kinase
LWLSDNHLSGPVPVGFSSLSSLKRLQLQNNNLEGCFDEVLKESIICDVSNNPLTCHPAQCTFTLLNPSVQPESSNSPAADNNLPVALGVSIPIGLALIAGIVVLIIMLQRRKKKKQSQLLSTRENNQRLSQVLPSNMVINFKDLKFGTELGSGDFGKVFQGEWHKSKVAIKVNTSGDLESFYNEAELMLNLRPHPNVVQTLGYCQESDKLVVVVEFCEGGSLDKKLFDENDFVSPIDQFNLIWNIAKGVYHLHENKIIHRDLAARNILLAHGVPKISDFGLSRKVEQVQKHSQTKTTLGPIRWMAPESLRSPIYNEKTDVWSFGIVCWEIVCRQEPHLNEDPLSIGGKIRDECFTPLIPDDCNPKIKQLMKDCWNPNPEDRPDIKSICDRLEKIFV